MTFQEFSKKFNGSTIWNCFYYQHLECYLLFWFLNWMIYNLLYYHLVHLYNIAINVLTFLNNYSLYSIKIYINITTCKSFELSIWILFISLMQSENGAEFLSITPLFLSSAAASLSPSPVMWRYYKQQTVWWTTYLGFLISAKRGLTL